MSPEQLKLISSTLQEIARTVSLIAIVSSLEKAVTAEERYILCQSLSSLLNNMLGNQRAGRFSQPAYEDQMFY
jgi:hypothetical protein